MSGMSPDLLYRLSVALAIGFLLGLERGWQEREAGEGRRAAGVRTFSLLGLLGGVGASLSETLGGVVPAATLLAAGLAVILFMYHEAQQENNLSATSGVAALLALALGALAVLGDAQVASAAAVAATVLLAVKGPLHSWVARLTGRELNSGLLLAAMTLILLPLLPDRPVDPWGVLNPHQAWLMTVLVAAVSFAGYCFVRLAGPRRGALLSAVAGGLASSTATTLSFARLQKVNRGRERVLAACIVTGNASMMLRVIALVSLIAPALLDRTAPALVAAIACSLFFTAWVFVPRGAAGAPPSVDMENPFELVEVLKFGALLTAILFWTHLSRAALGDSGLLVAAAISGLADVDAITLTTARLSATPLSLDMAAAAILIAVFVNSLTKAGLAGWVGGWRLGTWVLAGVLPSAVGAALTFLFVES